MSDIKWIKVTTDIFDDEKMILIEQLPNADSIIVIWFKLLCLAGKTNNSGVFMVNGKIPYTVKMLASIFRRKEATVSLALKTFEEFGMVEIIDGTITIPNWGKHQNFDKIDEHNEYMKEYMREYREKQKKLACKDNSKVNSKDNSKVNGKVNGKDNSKSNVSSLEGEEEREEEKEGDGDNNTPYSPPNIPNEKEEKETFGEYRNVKLTDSEYNRLAGDYGEDLRNEAIKFFDEYIEEKGYKSKSHNLAIRRWVIDAVKERAARPPTYKRGGGMTQLEQLQALKEQCADE